MPARLRRACFVAAGLALLTPAVALAAFDTTALAPTSVATATLAAPTSPGTSFGACTLLVSDTIVVSWTATSSTWAGGYEVYRSTTSGGPYTLRATVPGQSSTSFSDGGLAFSTTYYYVVRATKNAWRSPYTAQVSRTTRTSLCLL
ncbi:MAG: fibronectin type III domain-containing protein [Acidimicrobiales bacterium]